MSELLDSRAIVCLLNGESGSAIAEHGLTEDMFESEARPVFHMIKSHFAQHNKLPGKPEVVRLFPGFKLKKATEPLAFYVAELLKRFKFRQFKEIIGAAVEGLGRAEDLDVDAMLKETATRTGMILQCGVTRAKDYRTRIDDIADNIARKRTQAADFSFGFPALDKDLIGVDRGNLVLLAGAPGVGKSWLLLQAACNVWQDGYKVLVVSLEMPARIIQDRLDAIMCKMDYNKYRRGIISAADEKLLYRMAKRMRTSKNDFNLLSFENYDSGAKTQLGSVESLRACVQRYAPDYLFVDGIYLGMSLEWEKATKFANDFHAMLVGQRIPCMATTQMKQDADETNPRLRDLAFTAGFQHAASYVLMITRCGEGKTGELLMRATKVREAQDRSDYFVDFKPATKIEVVPMVQERKSLLRDDDDEEYEEATEE
jgi:KaiC/GvpD/RAD55 family RecA-like ATPase